MKTYLTVILLLLAASTTALADDPRWYGMLGGGLVYNFRTPLSARQDGKEVIDLGSAEYQTYPGESPYYWDIKIGRTDDGVAWEVELIHHKIYLRNTPANTEYFSVSHGYNLLYVNRTWEKGPLLYRLGGGLVIGHPESRINGRTYEKEGGPLPFDLGGPAVQAAAEKRWTFETGLLLSLEAKLTAAYAIFPISGGQANVPNLAAHFIGSIGWKQQ